MNNIFKQNEIENKLRDFKEGKDYSVLWENDKKTYNFRNIVLSEIFKRDYITVYEVAENWDSDNFNHHREAAEYEGKNGSKITYRYEHRINKGDGDYYAEWSGSAKPEAERIEPNFNDGYFLPSSPKRTCLEDFKRTHKELTEKLRFYETKPESYFQKKDWTKENSIVEIKEKLIILESKIEHEEKISFTRGFVSA